MKLISGQVNGSSYKFMATWYKGVKDTTKLVELITTPDFAQTHDFAFINAHSVPGIKCLIAAVNRTIYSKNTFQLKTGNAYTEVIYNLSPSTSVRIFADSFNYKALYTSHIFSELFAY
ncbi:hypothetical protein AX774_g1400 [Zancudomyces culisetae]|uniref:EKC/KEOPS complex subunit CGI121 n=1 Tax=Zancudomyces culisetae TaxID=1213189 RepID=A0A1R1PVW0_ZANCU|nr:hypothetical protein AX774_g1400 [Zancudomyces culisetae]|eukprot:OMH85074.1 hypothetical protein AX774_g1400 [Zancudomyces culisetae]